MDINDLKKVGVIIQFDNSPYQVVYSQHARTAQRKPFVRTKLKNLITGQILEKTFNGSDRIQEPDVEKSKASFLYAEGDKFFFMDSESYEQFFLTKNSLGGREKFLKEGLEVRTLIFNKEPVNIELPTKIDLRVVESPPSIKGNSATTPTKVVLLETGAEISAPIFIKKDDVIRVNAETGEYVERV